MNRLKCIILTMLMLSGISLIALTSQDIQTINELSREIQLLEQYTSWVKQYVAKADSANWVASQLNHYPRSLKPIIAKANELDNNQLDLVCSYISACYNFIMTWKDDAIWAKVLEVYKEHGQDQNLKSDIHDMVKKAQVDPNSQWNIKVVKHYIDSLKAIPEIHEYKHDFKLFTLPIHGITLSVGNRQFQKKQEIPELQKKQEIPGTPVELVNWSSKYKIAIQDKTGKWIQIDPRTRTHAEINKDANLSIRACDGKSTTTSCGVNSTGDFTWNGNKTYPNGTISNDISRGRTVLVFDAGNSFFSGLNISAGSTVKKTVKITTLLNTSPQYGTIKSMTLERQRK